RIRAARLRSARRGLRQQRAPGPEPSVPGPSVPGPSVPGPRRHDGRAHRDGRQVHGHRKDGDLAAARADLRAAVVTERRFDRQLIALSFPPRTEPFVRLLYRVNQARAELTSTAAGATSPRELRGYQRRLDAANEPVEDAVLVIRAQLGLPPPDTS